MKWISFILLFVSVSAWSQGSFRLFKKAITYPAAPHARDVYVYLPEGYGKTNIRYPVLYMQDGQNLFDPHRAYLGQTWRAQSTLNELISKKLMAPIIVVAIDNTQARMDEYIPEKKGNEYLDFVINDLKPQIDQNFRTKTNPLHTGILGSSLGGLISLYAGLRNFETFGLVGALSPSIWWNERSIIDHYRVGSHLPRKIYLDSGNIDGEKPEDVLSLSRVLQEQGFQHAKNLCVYIQDGAAHREYFWAQRLPVALQFLFPYSP